MHHYSVLYSGYFFIILEYIYPSSRFIMWCGFLNTSSLCLQLIHCLVDRIMEIIGCPFVAVGEDMGYYIKLSNVKQLQSPCHPPQCSVVLAIVFYCAIFISIYVILSSVMLTALLGINCRNRRFFQVDKLASFTEGSPLAPLASCTLRYVH